MFAISDTDAKADASVKLFEFDGVDDKADGDDENGESFGEFDKLFNKSIFFYIFLAKLELFIFNINKNDFFYNLKFIPLN